MKKIYFFTTLVILAMAVNLNAQYVELNDKEPIFRLKFEELDGSGKILAEGTEAFGGFFTPDSSFVEVDTIKGHAWGGGTFADFTFLDQVVASEAFPELFLPAMHWDSYLAKPDRPQGVAAYSNSSGAYGAPRSTSARTITLYFYATDSIRSGEGAWQSQPGFYVLGAQGDPGTAVRWRLDIENMSFRFDWNGALDSTAANVIETGQWVHLALTMPEGGAREGVKFYINGVEEELFSNDPSSDVTTIDVRYSGTGWDGIFLQCFVNVWMADYRVYDSELTADEIGILLGRFPESTPNYDQKSMFNVYPVPNNGIFTIKVADQSSRKVAITNALGQIVHRQLVDREATINISNLPSGVYFISMSDDRNNYQVKKILKE